MGEYYLKCEPTNTKENMKDVLKFVNNPIFNSSVFSKDTLNSYFKILLTIISIGLLYMTGTEIRKKWNMKNENQIKEGLISRLLSKYSIAIFLSACFILSSVLLGLIIGGVNVINI